jgi:hypothetical protein
MFRFAIAALGAAVCFIAPATAQTFTHTVNGQHHSHDITTYTTSGDCCQHTSCGQTHTTHSYTQPTTRTYTRSYTSAPTVTRTYTQPVQTTRIVQTYAQAPRIVYVQPSYHAPAPRIVSHNDRAQPYAHYDRNWKSRTHVNANRHHTRRLKRSRHHNRHGYRGHRH